MNKGRLFFDPLRFKKLKAQEDRRRRAKIYIVSTTVFATLIFVSLSVFGFSKLNYPTFGKVLSNEVYSVSKSITNVSESIFLRNQIDDDTVICSNIIVENGESIVTSRIQAEKKALEEQKILEEKKKKEEAEKKRLLAIASKPKSKPKTTTESTTSNIKKSNETFGGDSQKIDMDLNNDYLPVNPEDLDPTGNYGIPEYWPIQNVPISSKYGYLPKRGRSHAGVDLVADSGTPICAAGAGKVIRAEWFAGYGNCIDIQHSSGYITRYGHLSGFFVKKGDFVDAGDWIGSCGSTGRSSCPHLHFEVHKNGRSMNPESKVFKWTGKP